MTKEVLLTNTCNDGRWRGIAGRARNDGRGDRIAGTPAMTERVTKPIAGKTLSVLSGLPRLKPVQK